jgi:hypothetical protein
VKDTSWQWRGVVVTAVAVGALFALVVGSALAVLSAVVVYAVAMVTGDAPALDTLVTLWLTCAVVAVAVALVPAALVVRHHGGAHAVAGPVVGVVACLTTWTVLSVATGSNLVLLAGPLVGAAVAGRAVRPRLGRGATP